MENDKQRRGERDAATADTGKDHGEGVAHEAAGKASVANDANDANASKSERAGADVAPARKGAPEGAKAKKPSVRRGRNQKSPRAERTRPVDHVRVADGALRSIIGLAAHEVPGVVGMAPVNIGEGLRRILGARQVDEGVSVEHPHGEDRANVDIHVVVAYGVNIPVVAEGVRDRVRYAAKQYAGVALDEVRVHVEGVSRG